MTHSKSSAIICKFYNQKSTVELIRLPAADKLGEDLVNKEDDEGAGEDDPATRAGRHNIEVRSIF